MCGIVGYIGKQKCVDILFDGLSRLEYRGYDSAGIAVLDGSEIGVVKAEGKLTNLSLYSASFLQAPHAVLGTPAGLRTVPQTQLMPILTPMPT